MSQLNRIATRGMDANKPNFASPFKRRELAVMEDVSTAVGVDETDKNSDDGRNDNDSGTEGLEKPKKRNSFNDNHNGTYHGNISHRHHHHHDGADEDEKSTYSKISAGKGHNVSGHVHKVSSSNTLVSSSSSHPTLRSSHHHHPASSSSTAFSSEVTSSSSSASHHHSSSSHNHNNTVMGLLMLVDGIGLAIITTATILEGYDLWIEFFHPYWDAHTVSLFLWFTGRTFQIIGLLFLIGHASSFQIFPEIERFGMLMLTVGPIVNMSACYLFSRPTLDPDALYQKQWFSTELLELSGILILDISLIDMEELYVLVAELVGFAVLCCAAMLSFEYPPGNSAVVTSFAASWLGWSSGFPLIGAKLDTVHCSECFGLVLLMVVAYGQFRVKSHKHAQQQLLPTAQKTTHSHSHISHNSHSNNQKVAMIV